MWQPLLMFLKGAHHLFAQLAWPYRHGAEYPNSWTLDADSEKEDGDEDEDSENDDDDAPKAPPSKPSATALATPSQVYVEFLQFLATGCSGSPAQGYPAVLIILSTIPTSVRACMDTVLTRSPQAYNSRRSSQPRPLSLWKTSSHLSGPLSTLVC